MMTKCFTGVDVVVAPATVPARDIMDAKNPKNRINGINSNRHIWSIFFTEDMSREYDLRSNVIKNSH
jgi:hypothetical protein